MAKTKKFVEHPPQKQVATKAAKRTYPPQSPIKQSPKKQPVKKQPAKKQPVKKQPAKKQPAKKQPVKKQPAKKQLEIPSGSEATESLPHTPREEEVEEAASSDRAGPAQSPKKTFERTRREKVEEPEAGPSESPRKKKASRLGESPAATWNRVKAVAKELKDMLEAQEGNVPFRDHMIKAVRLCGDEDFGDDDDCVFDSITHMLEPTVALALAYADISIWEEGYDNCIKGPTKVSEMEIEDPVYKNYIAAGKLCGRDVEEAANANMVPEMLTNIIWQCGEIKAISKKFLGMALDNTYTAIIDDIVEEERWWMLSMFFYNVFKQNLRTGLEIIQFFKSPSRGYLLNDDEVEILVHEGLYEPFLDEDIDSTREVTDAILLFNKIQGAFCFAVMDDAVQRYGNVSAALQGFSADDFHEAVTAAAAAAAAPAAGGVSAAAQQAMRAAEEALRVEPPSK